MDPKIFKAYDIRGLYPEQLDEQAAWKIGHATAQFLRSMVHGYNRGLANAQSICVGHDMRTHSPALAKALIEGMNTSGANVIGETAMATYDGADLAEACLAKEAA